MNYGQITSTESMRELRERKKREGLKEINFYIPVALFDEIKRNSRQWKGFNQYVGDQLVKAYTSKGAATRFLAGLDEVTVSQLRALPIAKMGTDEDLLKKLVFHGFQRLQEIEASESPRGITVKNRDAKPKAGSARARASQPKESKGIKP